MAIKTKNMYVEAIIEEDFDTGSGYVSFYKGDSISGNVRSYNQDFMNVYVCEENKKFIETENDFDGYDMFHWAYVRVNITKGTIKKVFCGCNNPATKEINGEYLCNDCKYEEPYHEILDTGHHAMDYLRDWND